MGDTSPPTESSAGTDPGRSQLLERLRAVTAGEYDIFGELGRGGMATVYLAHDLSLDRKVAIKVLAPELTYGTGMVERFKREARTAAALSHPNILPIYAVREVEGLLFFVMKLVRGRALDSIIREASPLPVPMVRAILGQVGGAFGYAHRQGVIHRDIKPGNILVDEEGWAWVADFGIAKVADADGLTMTGMAVGTPAYMSPEQCAGNEITSASDQYSLGIVAYEMLAGRPPFPGTSMVSVMYRHFHDPVPPLAEQRPDCPAQVSEAVHRMLAKDPAARWPSVEAAIAAVGLETLGHDHPTRTQLISLARTGTAHELVARVQTPQSPVPLARTPTTPAAPAAQPRTVRGPLLIGLGIGVGAALIFLAGTLLRSPAGGTDAGSLAGPEETLTADSGAGLSAGVAQPPGAGETTPPAVGPPTVRAERPVAVTEPRIAATPGPAPAAAPPPPPPPPPPVVAATPRDTVVPDRQPAVGQATLPAPRVTMPPTPPPVSAVSVDRDAIESALQQYGRAIESGSIAQVRQAFPGIAGDQRDGLASFFAAGGRIRTLWTINGISVDRDAATARIRGSNEVTPPRGRPSREPVDLLVRLTRGPSGWQIVSVTPGG